MTEQQEKTTRARKVAFYLVQDIQLMLEGHREAEDFWKDKPNGVDKAWYFRGAIDLSGSITDTLARRMSELLEMDDIEAIITKLEA